MPPERDLPGPLELAHELAQERRVPLIRMRRDEIIRLLERKQVEDEAAHGRRVADGFVEDVRVAGRGHAVCALGQVGDAVDDGVAHGLDGEPVREAVDVQQREGGGLAVLEEELGRFEALGIEPEDDVLEVPWVDVAEGYGLGDAFTELTVEGGGEERGVRAEEIFVD
jgi:hypothetical protein